MLGKGYTPTSAAVYREILNDVHGTPFFSILPLVVLIV